MAESGISLFSCARSTRHDEEDAKRFHKQILMALDGEVLTDSHRVTAGVSYTMGDVARGDDAGGTNNPAAALFDPDIESVSVHCFIHSFIPGSRVGRFLLHHIH